MQVQSQYSGSWHLLGLMSPVRLAGSGLFGMSGYGCEDP